MSKTTLIIGGVLVAALGAGVWLALRLATPPPDISLVVTPGPFEEVIEAEGHVDAQRYHDICAPICRYERRVIYLVEEGTAVQPGDLLAQFDPGSIEMAIEDLEDRLRLFDQSTADIHFRSKSETYEQQVQAEIAKQRVVLGAIRKEISQYESSLRKSTVDVELNNQIKWANYARDQRKRLNFRDQVTDRNRAVQRDFFQQKINDLKEDSEQLNIYAENAGVVLYPPVPLQGELRKVQTGDYLDRGQLFLRIPEPGSIVVRFRLEEAQVNRLREKMEIVFTTAAYPGEVYRGRVLSISHFAELSSFVQGRRLYEVLARAETGEAQPPLKIGMVAKTRFRVQSFPRVYAFPKEWVRPERDGVSVAVFDGRGMQWISVRNPTETADYVLAETLPGVSGPVTIVMASERDRKGVTP